MQPESFTTLQFNHNHNIQAHNAPFYCARGERPIANNDEGADDLTTRLAGSFTGWDGDTVFRLENGQLWQQIDSSYLYSRSESPRVTIRRAAFGSYLLQVEGIDWTVRVRRLE